MKEIKIEKCPFCGEEEFIETKVASYGTVEVSTSIIRTQPLFAIVCRNCGSVVRTFCKDPEKLYSKKERR